MRIPPAEAITREIAGIERAKVCAIAVNDPDAAGRIVELASFMNPTIEVIVRSRFITEVDELHRAGASDVVPDELEAAVGLVTRVLRSYRMPDQHLRAVRSRIRAAVRGHHKEKKTEEVVTRVAQPTVDEMRRRRLDDQRAEGTDVAALIVVAQRPKELTRAQLKDLALQLDTNGFTERGLQTAWREKTNQDIAATILGFIRQAALGDALVPYQERVDAALKKLLASQPWTKPQRDWLERIGKQLKKEKVVDRAALDEGQFAAKGGFQRINKVFDGKLEDILLQLGENIWPQVG